MVRVKIILKRREVPKTVHFHLFIRTKNTLDVQHLRMERVTIVQQRWTQKEIWLIGLVVTYVANMTVTVSFIFCNISKVLFVYTIIIS